VSRPCLGIGVDLASVDRVGAMVDRYPDDVLGHVFTAGELAAARARPRRRRLDLTVCFAAKEAVGKALGVGLAGIDWTDVESAVSPARLAVSLSGAAARRARLLGSAGLAASWATLERRLVLVQVVVY
jgi:holo-[acyl-carrier protein] synthase